jgi:hypothetical protein
MSADYYVLVDSGGPTPVIAEDCLNITYNLTPMLVEAGFPGHRAMTDAPCTEAGGVFARTARRLRDDPERFKALNPPNGWGTYEGAIEFCDRLADACSRHPKGRLDTWL